MKPKICITGATGNVGIEVVRLLLKHNIPVVAAVTNIKKAGKLLPKGTDMRRFDFTDSATYEETLKDIDTLFLIRPPQMADAKKEFLPFLQYLKKINIKKVVFLSLLGAEKNRIVPHRKIEDYIKKLGLPYTFLRPSFFMQNFNTTHRDEIKKNNELYIPAGKGKTSFIDVRDIAAVAAKVLNEPDHIGKAYSLTGNVALDYYKVAEIFSDELGRKIIYKNPSILSFILKNKKQGLPSGFIFVMVGIYSTAKLGFAAKVIDDFIQLMKRDPVSFQQYVHDYKDYWISELSKTISSIT